MAVFSVGIYKGFETKNWFLRKVLRFFGASLCFHKDLYFFKRASLIFHGAPCFCRPRSFFIGNDCFLIAKIVFQSFGLKRFGRRCCGFFFIGIYNGF